MVMIEITEDKFDDLYDNIESMLGFGSKAMSCLKTLIIFIFFTCIS